MATFIRSKKYRDDKELRLAWCPFKQDEYCVRIIVRSREQGRTYNEASMNWPYIKELDNRKPVTLEDDHLLQNQQNPEDTTGRVT